jgi:hypothetical protein
VKLLGLRKILRRSRRGHISKLIAMLPVIVRGAKAVMQMRAARRETAPTSGR